VVDPPDDDVEPPLDDEVLVPPSPAVPPPPDDEELEHAMAMAAMEATETAKTPKLRFMFPPTRLKKFSRGEPPPRTLRRGAPESPSPGWKSHLKVYEPYVF
jgi:hypothetical protein